MQFVDESTARALCTMKDAIAAIEAMFRDYAQEQAKVFPVVQGHGPDPRTTFSVKSGLLQSQGAVGLKVGSYWPGNRARGLASHASSTLLLDADTGYVKALVESSYLTALRTAASDAVAVKYLSREDSKTLAVIGSGHQAWYELLAVREVRPITRIFVANRSSHAAETMALRIQRELGVDAVAAPVLEAVSAADIIVTVTSAREQLFRADQVRPGTHISAMGADGPGKQELDTRLVANARLFADVVSQSVTIGEYEAAHAQGLVSEASITSIGAVLTGAPGRTAPEQITIYDSSGMALQDLAIGAFTLQRAVETGMVKTL